MVARHLARKALEVAQRYPVVTVTGPRQSGKTTLVRGVFRNHRYASLEPSDQRTFALEDPRGFLGQFKDDVILDEAQRAPELFSYIQGLVDEDDRPGRFILTGSHNFLLLKSISQSLAGRAAILHLLPFSFTELHGERPIVPETIGAHAPRVPRRPSRSLEESLVTGFYPRIHEKRLPPQEWFAEYVQTYVERDVRSVLNIGDLDAFGRFLRLCAGRSGQVLNLSSLASDCGVSHVTARRWMSVLEASFVVVLLRPYYRNFGKRLIKAPKLHFLDTGLLSHLLGIRNGRDLESHAARGSIFESFAVSEILKAYHHAGRPPALFYWRDSNGSEVDMLIENGDRQVPIEVKSGKTVGGDFFRGLEYWRGVRKQAALPAALVYGGNEAFSRRGVSVLPWFAI